MEKEEMDDEVRLEKESVIPILKVELVRKLASLIEHDDRAEFEKLCKRVEYTIRAWYSLQFEELMDLYIYFDPVNGEKILNKRKMSPGEIETLELSFLTHLFQMMEKSSFKLLTKEEYKVAQSGQYLLKIPIEVDESKVDQDLFRRYFRGHQQEKPQEDLPDFADKYIIFRRGIGEDQITEYFFKEKVNVIISRAWRLLLRVTRIDRLFTKKQERSKKDTKKTDEPYEDVEDQNIIVKRIRLEKMELSITNLLGKTKIQEPTFERMIVVYRRASTKDKPDRGIFVKHFKHIPMADMELVLQEKKNPSLTPTDWVKFLVSAIIVVATLICYLLIPKADIWIVVAILAGVIVYCAKIYLTFRANKISYQNLITKATNDNQLDSGKGTLLHLCHDVIQQEVKEVILSYYILMEQGKATIQDIDLRCEQLMKEEFEEDCNFDVADAVKKLEKLGIVTRDKIGRILCVPLKKANDAIGNTTEEKVVEARQAKAGP
ncbi:hypothetical protein EJB05_30398 [Eragrostis curvula]|uniref:Aminopeptidase n=1 Tax=Eragrostis curvula TaxID=38414 RepID=A0A5J9UAP2_9POAL|nr:hypothetical protein EJB05_30398 [Eragrostis curvula]